MYYSTDIFKSIGLDSDWSTYATLILAAIQVAMTFVSMVLVEVAGRRILLLGGLSGMSFFCFVLSIARILSVNIKALMINYAYERPLMITLNKRIKLNG